MTDRLINHYFGKKLAFVFGASEGIGASVCRLLCANGCTVLAFSRSEKKLQALSQSILNAYPSATLHVFSLDVTDQQKVEKTLKQLVQAHGVPYFIMNFAGVAKPGFIDQLDIADFRQMMELNYFGTLNVVKTLSADLLRKREGHIVNCSSIAGFLGLFGYTGYCASKFAVIGFSEALKREWAPFGIRVSVLCPPNTKTPGLAEENRLKPPEILATEEKVTSVEPDFVAKILLRRLPKGEFLIVPTFDGKAANYLNRISPKIIDFFVKRP